MSGLAVFDFDQTVVAQDSDAAVMELLERCPPEPELGADWTPYMNQIFSQLSEAGVTKEEVLSRVGRIAPVPGACELIVALRRAGWECILLTDSNSVFVNHWLKVHQLQEHVSAVLTNPASWRGGRLLLTPCGRWRCGACPSNLCKGAALEAFRARRAPYASVLYVGDGANDVCPMCTLSENDVVCPRVGFPCHKVLDALPVRARVLPWRDHYDIIAQLFPSAAVQRE